ncbi:ROK family protein [Ideonella sp. BN130291]|uniref:ROK family protein n=1 Tax=Ideonella sp. BN130291 TaxID=3112940 RepID=UPI003FA578FA
MAPWSALSADELQLLVSAFWSAGGSRHHLADRLGYSKSKTNALIAGLVGQGLLAETGVQPSNGGRRPESLRLNDQLGVVVAVDIGVTSLHVAVFKPDLSLLGEHAEPIDVREQGPGAVLPRVRALMQDLLQRCGASKRQVLCIGIGVPGPVNFQIGQLVNPPLMPGWEGFSLRDDLREDYAAPVFVDNDVNLMAFGELWRLQRSLQNFVVIKVGTGIGCGIVCHGEVYRGATGSAGDVGHICVDQAGPRCYCGNLGCVEAMAAGPAIVRGAVEAAQSGRSPVLAEMLRTQGQLEAVDVAAACRSGDAAASDIVQQSGRLIGQMLASVVNFFNPSHVFLGGGITRMGPLLLAAVRQSVYQRSLALSTRHLEVQYTPLGEQAGVIGAAVLAMHETLRAPGAAR